MPKTTRRNWSVEQKAEILRRFHESGLSREAFAREEGISGSVLGNWVRKEREGGMSRLSPGLVSVRLKSSDDSLEQGFLDVVVHGGRLVRVRPGFDEKLLEQLVVALERC